MMTTNTFNRHQPAHRAASKLVAAIAVVIASATIGGHTPTAHAGSTRQCDRTNACTVYATGAVERDICYTAKLLGSHTAQSGQASFTFTTANSLTTSYSVSLGLTALNLSGLLGITYTNQSTTGISVTVPVRAGQTAYLYSRAHRYQYSITKYDRNGRVVSRSTGVAVTPIKNSFCSFVRNF